jgi:hypothetical protein
MLLHLKSDKFWVITGKTAWPGSCVLVDFVQALLPDRVSEKFQFLYYIAKIKTNTVLRFRQVVPFCFLFVPWS